MKTKIDEGWHAEIFLTGKGTVIKKFKKGLEKNFEKEIYFLSKLKNFDFVPKLISYNKENLEIEMEYIDGITFEDFIKIADKNDIKKVIIKIIEICFTLDKIHIQKEEMHRPLKHIIIKDNRIVLIDWERAKETNKPKNLTQFFQFLTRNDTLKEKGIDISDEIKKLIKEYKKSYSNEIYEKIKKYIENV